MQNTSETWKSLAAIEGTYVESRAIINNTEYSDIEPPVVTRALMQDGLEVGNVVSAMCTFVLDDTNNIPKSAEVRIETRLVGSVNGEAVNSEWLPQGTFFVAKRVRDPMTGMRQFECYDALLKTNAVWEPASSTWPQQTEDILDEILLAIGLDLDARTSITSYPISQPDSGTTMRDVLSIIAQHNGGNWIVTPDNKLRLVPIQDLNDAGEDVVEIESVIGEYYTGEINEISGIRVVSEDGDSLIGDETGAVVSVAIPEMIAVDLAEELIGKTYRPFSFGNAGYDIAAELGDYIQCEDTVSVIYAETITLGTTMHGDISAPDLAEIVDEYPYVGSSDKTLVAAKAYAVVVADAARDAAIDAASAQLAEAVVDINSDIEDLQDQIDGNITTWFYAVNPTLNNPPANAWTTDAEKNNHIGDLYYNAENGYCWRFMLANGQYSWQRISDTDITTALANAQHAQDTADGKRRVFVVQPTPPYDVGDLWVQGTSGDIMRCSTAKATGAAYSQSDWVQASKYTDDTTANNAIAIANAAIKNVDVEYAENQSTTTAPTSGWQTTAPVWREGYYIWQRTKTTTSTGSSYSTPTCISGRDGVDGATGPQGPQGEQGATGPQGPQGVGIASVTEYYALSNSGTTAPADSAFSTGVKTPTASNKYVWNYELITYTDSSTSKTTKHIAATYGDTGATGATGNGISSITEYYAVNNSTTAPADSAFSTTISQPTASNRYLWNYELTTYTSGATVKTGKRVIGTYGETGAQGPQGPQGETGATGPQGNTGVGVSGIVEQYYLSTSSTTQTGGSWDTTQPEWVSGKYIWTRSQVTWTNGSTTYTSPVLAQAINGANSTANTANNNANAASAAVTALDNSLTQQEIFNRLTDNGAAQGMVLYNGQLYINASYINTGYLNADQIASQSINGTKIAAGAISADKIAAGAISADMITAGEMSADRIQGGTLKLGGINNVNGELSIFDGNGVLLGRISNSGIVFVDNNIGHGIRIYKNGRIEVTTIAVYSTQGQKAVIAPLTSGGLAISDTNNNIIASFGTGTANIKTTFGAGIPNGPHLSVGNDSITLSTTNGRIFLQPSGDIEITGNVTMTEPLDVAYGGTGANNAASARANLGLKSLRLEAGAPMDNGQVDLGLSTNKIPLSVWSTNTVCQFYVRGSTATWWVRLIDRTTGANLSGTTTPLPINVMYIDA